MRCWLALTGNYGFLVVLILAGPLRASVIDTYHPLIVAGDPNGVPPDLPAYRVDPNTTFSPFAGVGSLRIVAPGFGSFSATAVAITERHILTAAHSLDRDHDGTADVSPEGITFRLNFGGDLTHKITGSALAIHPDFTGFLKPSVNDDLAVITLSQPLPTGVPVYDLYRTPLSQGDQITMVGYGWSGDGITGFTVSSDSSVKRVGHNAADEFCADDEGLGPDEVFEFDFDGPDGTTNYLGGFTLGNDIEAQLGNGDSGGPSFVFVDGAWKVAGVNTFGGDFEGGPPFPLFGSGGGGMLISTYASWIDKVIPEPTGLVIWSLLGAFAITVGWWRQRKRPA